MLAPLIEESLDASGGAIGGVLAGLLERACPVAVALERSLREKVSGKVRFVTALRVRAVFAGHAPSQQQPQQWEPVAYALDIDARSNSSFVTVIDVGRTSGAAMAQGARQARSALSVSNGARSRSDYCALPKLDELAANLVEERVAVPDRASSQVKVRVDRLGDLFAAIVACSRGDGQANPVGAPSRMTPGFENAGLAV